MPVCDYCEEHAIVDVLFPNGHVVSMSEYCMFQYLDSLKKFHPNVIFFAYENAFSA